MIADLLREWGPLMFALIPNAVLAAQWAMRKEFATTESLVGVHKVLYDQAREQAERITDAHHRIALLEERMKAFPGYDVTNDIKVELGELKEGQAAGRAKLDALKEVMDTLRESVIRIDGFLRSTK